MDIEDYQIAFLRDNLPDAASEIKLASFRETQEWCSLVVIPSKARDPGFCRRYGYQEQQRPGSLTAQRTLVRDDKSAAPLLEK
jgi:hypothetical protein